MPAVEDVEQRRTDLLRPSLLAPRQLERRDPRQPQRRIRRRQRLLTRPVMVAIMVSLVWRRLPALAAVQKVWAREGMRWVTPRRVSPQALTTRLDVLPAAVRGQLCAEVGARLQPQAPPVVPPPSWGPVREHVPRLAMVDGSTWEARRHKSPVVRERAGVVRAGTLLVLVEAFSHRPLWHRDTEDAWAHDQRCGAAILAALPVGGLRVCDLGLFSVRWFDDFTAATKFFVTRRREKTASRTVRVLNHRPDDQDELMHVGQYRSNPGTSPWRMVAVRWQGVWYRSLTHVLAPQVLSARQVCERSRRRWRSEEACALTTRRLDVADVWTGSSHGVQVQIYATLVFYAVLVTLGLQVAQALGEPLERISVEMVFRAFSHDSRAVQHGEGDELVAFLAEHAKLLGLVKRRRRQHRERQERESSMWGDP